MAKRQLSMRQAFPDALDLMLICVESGMSIELAFRKVSTEIGSQSVALDEEFLPFAPASFDLAVASLSLHWVNDLPGTLLQLRQTLRPGGLFLASLPALGTLGDFRSALTEAEIIRRVLGGETHVFAVLVSQYQRKALSLAERMMQDSEEARDLVQDAFVKAYRSLSSFKQDSTFSTWFYRIVYTTCLNALDKIGRAHV